MITKRDFILRGNNFCDCMDSTLTLKRVLNCLLEFSGK